MSTIQQVAEAFAAGKSAKCGNARTDGQGYYLHGHRIATAETAQRYSYDWCGWFTPTTQNHLNHIAKALNASRLSRAGASAGKVDQIGYFA